MPSVGIIYNRVSNNIKRYEAVYLLMMTIVNLLFLLFNKQLLVPTILLVSIPMLSLTINRYIRFLNHRLSIYVSMWVLTILTSTFCLCEVTFIVDCLLAFVVSITHMITFDSKVFETSSEYV
ncbi:Uncharacterized protein QTN25_010290 [Entamoeba marina]